MVSRGPCPAGVHEDHDDAELLAEKFAEVALFLASSGSKVLTGHALIVSDRRFTQ